jgi:nitroreductase
VEFSEVARRRRMVRAFDPARPVGPDVVDALVTVAAQAPSAGNTQGWHLVVLEGSGQTAKFWDASLPVERRRGFAWPGLLDAPVLACPVADPAAYVRRYAEEDKASTGLGDGIDSWSFPYWLTDTAFFTMQLLNAVTDAGLGACFFGLFGRAPAVADALGIPSPLVPIGMVAIGHPAADPGAHRPGRSAGRARRRVDEVVHRGGWNPARVTPPVG